MPRIDAERRQDDAVLRGAPSLRALVVGGVLGGMAFVAISPARWSGFAAWLTSAAARLARSPGGPAVLAAAGTALLRRSGERRHGTPRA